MHFDDNIGGRFIWKSESAVFQATARKAICRKMQVTGRIMLWNTTSAKWDFKTARSGK